MNNKRNNKVKGFTLVELIIVIAIIGALTAILVPTMSRFLRTARIQAAISDARTIKTTIEGSLMQEFQFNQDSIYDGTNAFNKRIFPDVKNKNNFELAGSFTSFTWYQYKHNKINENDGPQQKIEAVICKGLNAKFSETWSTGTQAKNPLAYNSSTNNCAEYVKKYKTNFGLVVVYDTSFDVRFMQIYRKGILVTYVDGVFIANDNADAHFIGGNTWNTVYTDVGKTPPPGTEKMALDLHQKIDGNWNDITKGWEPAWGNSL